jgi:CDP-glucose 4,6-dehydratase
VDVGRGPVEDLALSTQQSFWRGRRVLLTGHTGFKGAWMTLWLERAGAVTTGLALPPPEGSESLFSCLSPWPELHSLILDVRDGAAVRHAVNEAKPEIVIHMAAQAIVRRSYRDPVETFSTNVMGTVNVIAAAVDAGVHSILVVTSDKVYENRETGHPFREDDPLAGDDPYSASKAAAEAVARSWRNSFLAGQARATLGVARGGNVIGGGDWGEDRVVPDIIRAGAECRPVALRYPNSTRPWQHVLDVIAGYLAYAERLVTEPTSAPAALNFGPPPEVQPLTTAEVVERLQAAFGWTQGWVRASGDNPPEKAALALDSNLAAKTLGWRPRLDASTALSWVAAWHRAYLAGEDMRAFSSRQIEEHAALPATTTARTAA